MSGEHKELVKITKVSLTLDRMEFLCFRLHMDFASGLSGAFGGQVLDEYDKQSETRRGTAAGADFIRQILVTFGVEDAASITGKTCFAILDDKESSVLGVEVPDFKGGAKRFHVNEWRREWGYER